MEQEHKFEIKVPSISAAWELHEFDDGSLFFNNFAGRHRKLRSPGLLVREILRRVDGRRTSEQIAGEMIAAGLAKHRDQVGRVFEQLANQSIVSESIDESRPEWLPEPVYNRFKTEIEWLNGFATPAASGFTYFERLRSARVGIIGMGGAGSLCAVMLTAAGIGSLRIMDGDEVEESNLVRQVFYQERHVNTTAKVEAITDHLRAFSRFTDVEPINAFVNSEDDACVFASDLDFILLCADAPRFLLNRYVDQACIRQAVPYLNAFEGLIGPMFVPGVSPCFGCLEAYFREELGTNHDQIVQCLQRQRTRPYPSFIGGVARTAHLLIVECLGYLTQAWTPATLGNVVRLDYLGANQTPLMPAPNCPHCNYKGTEDGCVTLP